MTSSTEPTYRLQHLLNNSFNMVNWFENWHILLPEDSTLVSKHVWRYVIKIYMYVICSILLVQLIKYMGT